MLFLTSRWGFKGLITGMISIWDEHIVENERLESY